MTTTGAELSATVVVDTNVLLAATDQDRASHAAATRFLNQDERCLAISPQIVREYLAVATRPVGANGLGMTSQDAVANIGQFLEDMVLLGESTATTRHLLNLIQDGTCSGKQVHDANIVAVALGHHAGTIVTDNIRHFARFAELIVLEDLVAVWA